MSGGAFDYKQHTIYDIADSIQRTISRNTMVPYEEPQDDWELDQNNRFLEQGGERFSNPLNKSLPRRLRTYKGSGTIKAILKVVRRRTFLQENLAYLLHWMIILRRLKVGWHETKMES